MEIIELNIKYQPRKFHSKHAGLVYMPMKSLLQLYIRIVKEFKQ